MGSSSSDFQRHQWGYVDRNERGEIYQNQSGELAEKHMIASNPNYEEDTELQIYKYRSTTYKPIVKIYEADYIKADGICSQDANISIMSEYIPYRLAETCKLNEGQSLYIMSESVVGFHELYGRVGAFPINQTMIGFNQDGRTKVWCGPNFVNNHFNRDSLILMSTVNPYDFDNKLILRQEQDMVEDIWGAVERHSQMSFQFKNEMNGLRDQTFVEAMSKLSQMIASGKYYVPDKLRLEDKESIIWRASQLKSSSKRPVTKNSRTVLE